jgi:SAM-dependent methyltransferase
MFRSAGISDELLTFLQGDATNIPLPDDAFDVVTCQTVLMHLPRPLDALREMCRILRPGGLLICVEPNNLWNYAGFTSLTAAEPAETVARRFEFWLRYHRGKILLGEGDHTIGDLLPGYFAGLGLSAISVWQSDRCAALFPPYAGPEQQALLNQERQWRKSCSGAWDREAVRRQVLAGGGTAQFFDQTFAELEKKATDEETAIAAESFHAAGGGMTYLVSGRKPPL